MDKSMGLLLLLDLLTKIPTDRAALDEYMAVWFRYEVSDTVELRSMVVRLKENHADDSTYSEVLSDLVDKLCASVLKKEKDVSDMEY
nr:hypothetical protein [Tanacetum cinerariifolium]